MIAIWVDSHCPHGKYVANSFPQDARNILGIIVFRYETSDFLDYVSITNPKNGFFSVFCVLHCSQHDLKGVVTHAVSQQHETFYEDLFHLNGTRDSLSVC